MPACDVATRDPERGARAMMDLGFINERLYEPTLRELPTIRHDVWRKYELKRELKEA